MTQRVVLSLTTVLLVVAASSVLGFCPNNNPHRTNNRFSTQVGIFDKVGQFFEELDAFIDDATARRLGNGAAFYGKRKSSFYGKEDRGRKRDRTIPDPTEDYRGPTSSGFFKWVPDETGELRPVTRMKEKNLERNPNYEKFYSEQDFKNLK